MLATPTTETSATMKVSATVMQMMMMIIRGRSMMTTTLARRLHIVSQNQPRNALVTQDAVAVPDQVDNHTPVNPVAHATPAAVTMTARP